LERLVEHATELTANEQKQELVVNELKKTHTLDVKTGVWSVTNDKKGDKKGGTKKVEEVTTTNKTEPAKQLTEEEFAAMAPQSVQNKLAFADQEMQRQKGEAIELLIANVDDANKDTQRERLNSRTLVDLQADVAMLPVKAQKVETRNNSWNGANGAPPTTKVVDNTANLPAFGLPGDYIKTEPVKA
jgi:hypothetical protein